MATASNTQISRRTILCQLLVAMLASVAIGDLLVALPYFAKGPCGATDGQVGWMGGLYQGAYAVFVLFFRKHMDRFDLRRQAMLGCGLSAASLGVMPLFASVSGLLACMALFGVFTMLLWPPLMGWISRGAEGPALSRRLSWYNASWSLGLILGPVIGGVLYQTWQPLPFFAAGASLLLCVGLLLLADPAPPLGSMAEQVEVVDPEAPADVESSHAGDLVFSAARVRAFRRMARVGLMTSYLAIGLIRYQLPVVALDQGIPADRFGPISMTYSASLSLGFSLLALHVWWHFKRWPLALCQAAMAGGMLVVFTGRDTFSLYGASAICGLGSSLLYAAHLFYGVSGGRDRARRMALHELLLSVGFVTGAIGGGVLADHYGPRIPYWFVGMVLLCGATVVLTMDMLGSRKPATAEKSRQRDASTLK